MAGTKAGGMKAAATNRAKYGNGFYRNIGRKGGKNGHTGGFAANPKLARIAGAKGGSRSIRSNAMEKLKTEQFPASYNTYMRDCLAAVPKLMHDIAPDDKTKIEINDKTTVYHAIERFLNAGKDTEQQYMRVKILLGICFHIRGDSAEGHWVAVNMRAMINDIVKRMPEEVNCPIQLTIEAFYHEYSDAFCEYI